ncbi:MAG: hypothetical protein ACFFC6_05475 [Promethearchaeota archaeon]
MLNRSILTAVIGFLVGCLLYYMSEASVIVVLIMCSVGYFIGLFLDNADIKQQNESYRFSTGSPSQEFFQSADLPDTVISYSSKENLTTVSTDFQVETKPQTFRLSVLKNLQDHQFRIFEDSSNTIFSLTLDFPECNYLKLSAEHKEELHYNIRERSLDFKNAIQKIIPGLVLSQITQSDRVGQITRQYETSPRHSHFPPPSMSNDSFDRPQNGEEWESSHSIHDTLAEEESQEISESHIMEDLLPEEPAIELPDLSPDEVQQLKGSNQRQLEDFLNETDETDDIEIDFSKVNQPVNDGTLAEYEKEIIDKLEEKTQLALKKVKPDLDLEKEQEEVKKYITGDITSEKSLT